MINELSIIIGIPLIAGIILFLIPDTWRMAKGIFALLVSLVVLFFAILVFRSDELLVSLIQQSDGAEFFVKLSKNLEDLITMNVNPLSQVILLFIAVIASLIAMYSIYKEENVNFPSHFYS